MLRRSRTTKKLAKRIDLQYFARPHVFRRWRFWLSVAVPALTLLWFVTQRAQGGQKVYSSGPISASHAVFSQQCNLCHVVQAGVFTQHVTDKACLRCHDAPIHHASQTFAPECSSCHLEHKGSLHLAATSEGSCTQCHADLRTRDGQPPHYSVSIKGFDSQHPQFSALLPGKGDPGQIKFNHYRHLQSNLLGPDNKRVQLDCGDCHRLSGAEGSWSYGGAQVRLASATSLPQTQQLHGSRSTVAPPEFADNCSACHTLQFDKRFGNEQVPHDKPEVVRDFLVKKFSEYVASHPGVIHEPNTMDRQLPGRTPPAREARSTTEWVTFQVEDAEWLLWNKTCRQCHTLSPAWGPMPEIAKADVSTNWMPHARFEHQAHGMMTCIACHVTAPNSRETSDVLLPGIETCRQCHREQGARADAAEGRCFECHEYHDWTTAKPAHGRFTIPELRGSTRLLP